MSDASKLRQDLAETADALEKKRKTLLTTFVVVTQCDDEDDAILLQDRMDGSGFRSSIEKHTLVKGEDGNIRLERETVLRTGRLGV